MKRPSVFDDPVLAFCLLLATFLLFPDIPPWAFATALIFWFYRLIIDRSQWKAPSRWTTGFFSVLFLAINYFYFKTLTGKESSASFLVILLGLKILEYQEAEENGFLILLGFYLLTSKFLFAIDLLWISFCFPAMIVLVYYLLPSAFRKNFPQTAGYFIARSLLMSAPFTTFLFFYFPRYSNEMFLIENNEKRAGSIGFSENVEPGSVASLASSDEIAFRAEFINLQPQVKDLYWRGLTLTESKGLKWERNTSLDPQEPVYAIINEKDGSVRITIEPHDKQWLFTPEQTSAVIVDNEPISTNSLGAFKINTFLDRRMVYQTKTLLTDSKPHFDSDGTIHFVRDDSPAITALLDEWKTPSPDPQQMVEKISNFYLKNRFQYTLSPGDRNELSLSEFLFKTRKGFCEHYASATALLLNHLGIPARVIVGYYGGEYNPIGNFWTIRQREAHAWIEYLGHDERWHRYDPTAAVNPLRLALGALTIEQANSNTTLGTNASSLKTMSLWQKSQFYLESWNYRWSHFLLNFDIDKQKELLSELGVNLGTALLIGMFVTLILSLSFSWLFRTKIKQTRAQKIYHLINDSLKPFNLSNFSTEPPDEWKQRVSQALPSSLSTINGLFECYYLEAFANQSHENNWTRAKKLARALKEN